MATKRTEGYIFRDTEFMTNKKGWVNGFHDEDNEFIRVTDDINEAEFSKNEPVKNTYDQVFHATLVEKTLKRDKKAPRKIILGEEVK